MTHVLIRGHAAACPDDPARTADYGHFPWEREPEPETISDAAAVDVIIEALTTKQGAYGLSHGELLYQVADYVFNLDDQPLIDCLFAARGTAAVRKACGFIANEFGEMP